MNWQQHNGKTQPKARCKKKAFSSEQEAKQSNSGMTPYLCRDCKSWHHTSNGGYKIFKARGNPLDAMDWIRRHTRSRKKKRVKFNGGEQ